MNLLDLYENREPHQQAIDRLEQARIDHLKEKIDYYAEHKMTKEFKAAKEELESYYKIKDECMGYGGLGEAGIGQDLVNKTEKMARATPGTPAGKVASTVKNAAKWLAGKGGPGKEGPTYEGKDDAWQKETPWTNIPKAKSGKPVDPRGEVTHLSDVARREAELKAQPQKKNSKEVNETDHKHSGQDIPDPAIDRLLTKAHRERPKAKSDAEALAMKILGQEQDDVARLDNVNDREDRMIARLDRLEQELQNQIDQIKDTKELDESQQLHQGDPVVVTAPNEFEGKTGEIAEFSPSGKFVIVNLYNHGEQPMHLSDVEYNQYADDEDEIAEGWSDAIVSQRTGQPRTPYSVYIKGQKWKDFENDDHAEAVANKLRAKFKADGRDPSVITIAATDYDKGVAEGMFDRFKKANPGVDDAGRELMKQDRESHPDMDDYSWQIGWIYADGDMDVKAAYSNAYYDNPTIPSPPEPRSFKLGFDSRRNRGVAEGDPNAPYTPSPAKPFRNPPGFNKQGTGVGNKLAQLNRKEWEEKKKKEQGVAEGTDQTKQVFKDKSGKPVGEIGIDPESSPGNGEWYVYHYATGYSVVGFDSAAEAKRELMYVHKHPEAVEGHPSTKEQGVAEAQTDYQKRRQRERDVDAGKPVPKQREPRMTDYQKRRAEQKRQEALGEDQDTSGVETAIIRRIMVAHTDLLKQFGPEKVMQAAEEVAYNVGDVDEIGTSDVSAYVNQVKQILGVEA